MKVAMMKSVIIGTMIVGSLSVSASTNVRELMCDQCEPSIEELVSYRNIITESQEERSIILDRAVVFANSGKSILEEALRSVEGYPNASERISKVSKIYSSTLENRRNMLMNKYVNAGPLISQLNTVINEMQVSFSSEYEKKGVWLEKLKHTRSNILNKSKELHRFNVGLGYIARDDQGMFRFALEDLFGSSLSNIVLDETTSVQLKDGKLELLANNVIDEESCMNPTIDYDVYHEMKEKSRTSIKHSTTISMGIDGESSSLNLSEVEFLDRSGKAQIECKKVSDRFSKNRSNFDKQSNIVELAYEKKTSFSTDQDLWIFGGIYKSVYFFYDTNVFK